MWCPPWARLGCCPAASFELPAVGSETLLRFTLLTPEALPEAGKIGHLRRRLNHLLFADLSFSYGQ